MKLKNIKKIFAILILLICFINVISSQNFTLVLLSQQRGAACLDGSPIGLYIHEGTGQNKDNFIIYFQGGGYCGAGGLNDTLQACYQRTNGRFGTTKVCEPTADWNRKGIIATQKSLNPVFYDWTKIYAIYCDGTQYFGSRKEPISYKDKKLYFRGTNNILEQVKYLQDKYDIFNKNKIVITGVSAGGIATFLYSNLFYEKAIKAKVYSIPDSGLFLTDYLSPLTGKQAIRQASKALLQIVWGEQRYPLQKCLDEFNNDTVECFNSQNLVKYIKPPMLVIQSVYDHWAMEQIQGIRCYTNSKSPYSILNCNQTQMSVINEYRDLSRQAIAKMLKDKPDIGFWMPSCIQHGWTTSNFNDPNYKVPGITGKGMPETIQQFLDNPERPPIYIDTVNWPQNKGCNGLNNTLRVGFITQ